MFLLGQEVVAVQEDEQLQEARLAAHDVLGVPGLLQRDAAVGLVLLANRAQIHCSLRWFFNQFFRKRAQGRHRMWASYFLASQGSL